jgi:DNA polymerase III epsilon subunit-like protein|tara:strand:+ start:2114 stop:2701 length:588 start_codon:yes stop_codon:yes gene_type:complete
MQITVFDTETTGLKHEKHEIIELAFISYIYDDDGRHILKKYESKIKPQNIHLADSQALIINGYEDSKWVDAPEFCDIYDEVIKTFENSDLLLGQNLIFDLKFFNSMCQRNGLRVPKYPPYLDSKAVADRLVNEGWLKRSGMDYLCEYYKITSSGRAHTALVDCERTMKAWDKLQEDIGDEYEIYTFDKPYSRRRR